MRGEDKPWSDNPNAPKLPYHLYFDEKAGFAGYFVGLILYGALKVFHREPACPC